MVDHPAIRYAEARDASAVAALHADSWRRHYRGAYSDAYLDNGLDAERLAVWSERLDLPAANTVTLLAETDDVVVGFVHAILDNDPRWGTLIENLHVRYDVHRQGLGRHLMSAAAKAIAERSPRAPVHLWVLQQNSRAQNFYRALGGAVVEQGLCPPPGGHASRLHGSPERLRFVWSDPAALVEAEARPG